MAIEMTSNNLSEMLGIFLWCTENPVHPSSLPTMSWPRHQRDNPSVQYMSQYLFKMKLQSPLSIPSVPTNSLCGGEYNNQLHLVNRLANELDEGISQMEATPKYFVSVKAMKRTGWDNEPRLKIINYILFCKKLTFSRARLRCHHSNWPWFTTLSEPHSHTGERNLLTASGVQLLHNIGLYSPLPFLFKNLSFHWHQLSIWVWVKFPRNRELVHLLSPANLRPLSSAVL